MDRIQQGLAATLSATFQLDGVATDPSPATATVQILRDDGTELVAAGTATTHTTDGTFTYALSAANAALLDNLTLHWTSALGTLTTRVEIAGGPLFTIAEAQALSSLASMSVADISAARTEAERVLEDACGMAFVPRYRRQRLSGRGGTLLLLDRPLVRAVRSITLNGTALTSLTGLVIEEQAGRLYWPAGWAPGIDNYEIVYEHGHPFPPGDAGRIALRLARERLVAPTMDDRITRGKAGEEEFYFAVAGSSGRRFGIPDVDAFVAAHRVPAVA